MWHFDGASVLLLCMAAAAVWLNYLHETRNSPSRGWEWPSESMLTESEDD